MSEWDQRQLCPDGGCVGVIGPDGTCKVCGRVSPNWGDERKRGLLDDNAGDSEPAPDDEDDDQDDDDLDDEDENEDEIAAAPSGSDDPAWDQRKLCPDDACIGVIGADGTCKVCGRSAA